MKKYKLTEETKEYYGITLYRVNAQKHMCRLINANFGKNDLFYDLTYKGKEITREQAERDLDNFVERLRYHCKKRGIRMPK